MARLRSHIGLGPDDRGDALVPTRLVEVQDPVHVPVVGDAQRRLPVHGRPPGHQLADPGCPVEHGELGVGVQMRKRPPRHRPSFQRSNLQPCCSCANSGPYPASRNIAYPQHHRFRDLVVQGLSLLVPQRKEHVERSRRRREKRVADPRRRKICSTRERKKARP